MWKRSFVTFCTLYSLQLYLWHTAGFYCYLAFEPTIELAYSSAENSAITQTHAKFWALAMFQLHHLLVTRTAAEPRASLEHETAKSNFIQVNGQLVNFHCLLPTSASLKHANTHPAITKLYSAYTLMHFHWPTRLTNALLKTKYYFSNGSGR